MRERELARGSASLLSSCTHFALETLGRIITHVCILSEFLFLFAEPSREVTGGPWYTEDQELDIEFIESLRNEVLIALDSGPKSCRCRTLQSTARGARIVVRGFHAFLVIPIVSVLVGEYYLWPHACEAHATAARFRKLQTFLQPFISNAHSLSCLFFKCYGYRGVPKFLTH